MQAGVQAAGYKMTMPEVTIRYFAQLREARGCDDETIEVAPATTIGALYATLFPEPRLPVGYARNAQYVAGDTFLADGDEVVFIPPIGGG